MTTAISSAEKPRLAVRAFQWIALPLTLVLVMTFASLPMNWQQQAIFGGAIIAAALIVSRIARGKGAVYVLVLLSSCATARYAYWRIDALHHYFVSPWMQVDKWNATSMLLLICAEIYSFMILYLGFVQTIAPLRRQPVPLPEHIEDWPSVDVMVPTYNEPLDVVRYTVLAAQQIDWPQDKLNVWLLDDGDREQFRGFAEFAGVHYVARPEHNHAKAGNINYALERTTGDLIAIFDSDHIPTRSFLQVTVGWFLKDKKLGMLQTPHHFYSPDPFERNLDHFREVPNEGELFYGIIQDTNDLWNATFFCGSCAVLRRDALSSVGGIAHETVTEDAHTSFRMHKIGWNTAYINITQAAGLATESIADHVKQRVRWARGMAQILRIDNPLFARGLKWPQRLCYLNAMLHFFYALPRLIFLTAPIVYLLFGKLNIPGYWLSILVFAFPHLALATITNSRIQGEKRHSFWNEVYETVLSPYILLPTLLALISPKLGKFNVTAKGQNQEDDAFDSRMATPYLVLFGLNFAALFMALPRYLYWDTGHAGTIVMNVFWTLFNIVVLGVSLSVCWETRQRRTAVRVVTPIPVQIEAEGRSCLGVTQDVSVGGAAVLAKGDWSLGERVRISFPEEDDHHPLWASVVKSSSNGVSLEFQATTIEEQRVITRVLYSRADRWMNWSATRANDNPLRSFVGVLGSSMRGFGKMAQLTTGSGAPASRKPALGRGFAVLLLIIGVVLLAFWNARADTLPAKPVAHRPENTMSVRVVLGAFPGTKQGILLDRNNRGRIVEISLPSTVLAEQGELKLKYTLPDAGKGTASTLDVLLNDAALASITPTARDLANGGGEITIPLPADQLVGRNRFTLQLAGTADGACGSQRQGDGSIRIDPETEVSFQVQRLALASDLSLLPQPFLQQTAGLPTELPFVFAQQPDMPTLQAAGVFASWLGSQAYESGATFPTNIGSLPAGNAVVLLIGSEQLSGLNVPEATPASLSVVASPSDPYSKLLILRADNAEHLLALVQAVAIGQVKLSGGSASLGTLDLPTKRLPDDAPRWIHTDRISLNQLAGSDRIQTSGSNPVNLYLRFAPDYNFGIRKDMYLHLAYSSDAQQLSPRSNVEVRLNGNSAGSVPIHPGGTEAQPHSTNIALGDLPAAVFANTLQLQFFFVPPPAKACDANNNSAASIGSGSFLDMGGAPHLARLPDLRLFANAGYPFTRRADLADTTVLLSASPSAAELTLYLDLMGHFGAQTGYPALRVQVAHVTEAANFRDRNLLVLGTFSNLAELPEISAAMPLRFDGGQWGLSRRARLAPFLDKWMNFGSIRASTPDATNGIAPDGIVEGIESPFRSERSIVLVLARDKSLMAPFISSLVAQLPQDGIRENVSLWQGGNFDSYRLGAPEYSLGNVPKLQEWRTNLPRYPWVLALLLLLICTLLSAWMKIWIDHRIRIRLNDLKISPNQAG